MRWTPLLRQSRSFLLQVEDKLDIPRNDNAAAHKRLTSYDLSVISTAFLPLHANLFGNSMSNMVELQNLLMLPARRMKSLVSSLLLVAVTIRRRYCTLLSAARDINSGLGQSGTSSSVIGDGKLTRATEVIMAKTARKALGYCVVSQDGGTVPNSTCCLVGPKSALSSARLAGLTAQQLLQHVYRDACSCGMNCLTNGFCKHVWVAATTLKVDLCELVKTWATSAAWCKQLLSDRGWWWRERVRHEEGDMEASHECGLLVGRLGVRCLCNPTSTFGQRAGRLQSCNAARRALSRRPWDPGKACRTRQRQP
eukprot:4406606-Pleurochrysis_carterae.AAC.1